MKPCQLAAELQLLECGVEISYRAGIARHGHMSHNEEGSGVRGQRARTSHRISKLEDIAQIAALVACSTVECQRVEEARTQIKPDSVQLGTGRVADAAERLEVAARLVSHHVQRGPELQPRRRKGFADPR